ncbi:MAG TPA: hypothetical protein VFJ74_06880 [Gemmatimonadaceae bacterium]|nr:hypothetical protein [Gemmatimonadaceae bacterium]
MSQYDNGRKRELLQYLWDRGACDAAHAIDLSGADVAPSVLKSMVSRNVVRRTASGRYFLDASRVNEAYGASNKFILYALGATIVAMLVIMLW